MSARSALRSIPGSDDLTPTLTEDLYPIVLDNSPFYKALGLHSATFSDLDTAGLLTYTPIPFSAGQIESYVLVGHAGRSMKVFAKPLEGPSLPLGRVLFSKAGQQLARLCRVSPAPGLLDYLRTEWRALGWTVVDTETEQ